MHYLQNYQLKILKVLGFYLRMDKEAFENY